MFKKKNQEVEVPPKPEKLKRVLATELVRGIVTPGSTAELPHLEFPEQLFVKEYDDYHRPYGFIRRFQSCVLLDDAVECAGETEVAVYQLVRVKKFKKTTVESTTVEEFPAV